MLRGGTDFGVRRCDFIKIHRTSIRHTIRLYLILQRDTRPLHLRGFGNYLTFTARLAKAFLPRNEPGLARVSGPSHSAPLFCSTKAQTFVCISDYRATLSLLARGALCTQGTLHSRTHGSHMAVNAAGLQRPLDVS